MEDEAQIAARDPARDLARTVGGLLATSLGLVLVLALVGSFSLRGWASLAIAFVFVGALLWGGRKGRRGIAAALAALVVWCALVLAWPRREHAFLRAVTLPSSEAAPRWERLMCERDASSIVTPIGAWLGWGVSMREMEGLAPALEDVYDQIDRDDPSIESALIATALGMQHAERSDAYVHVEDASRWVIFLHGFGGNLVSGCWVIARAASDAGWSTVCPSTSIAGRWDQAEGRAILDHAIAHARGLGARRIVLAGLSNGAVAAVRIAAERDDLEALVLLSGVDWTERASELPTLVIHGTSDARFSPERVRRWADSLPRGELVMLRSDHLLLVKERRAVGSILPRFLRGLR